MESPTSNWTTPSFWETASLEDVIRCLDEGADIKAQDSAGNTPLHWAATQGDVEIVNALLQGGANPNALNEHGSLPLHKAAASSHSNSEVVDVLCGGTANIDAIDSAGHTPLYLASARDHVAASRSLRAAGASMDDCIKRQALEEQLAGAAEDYFDTLWEFTTKDGEAFLEDYNIDDWSRRINSDHPDGFAYRNGDIVIEALTDDDGLVLYNVVRDEFGTQGGWDIDFSTDTWARKLDIDVAHVKSTLEHFMAVGEENYNVHIDGEYQYLEHAPAPPPARTASLRGAGESQGR